MFNNNEHLSKKPLQKRKQCNMDFMEREVFHFPRIVQTSAENYTPRAEFFDEFLKVWL